MDYRIERDSLGEIKVPKDAYYGAFTARALKNFQLSGMRAERAFIKSLGLIKQAAAEVNLKLGLLEKKSAKAIIQAAKEFTEGKFDDEFPLDSFQAGAGTPFNMNANEVIANRANEILGDEKGLYHPVHPNNHVNMAQSSNDVIPTAIRLTCLFLLAHLRDELLKLVHAFKEKAKEYKGILKVGRTHLEDAVPITIDQEFEAWAHMLERTHRTLEKAADGLLDLPIGGTALGTGINTHPRFRVEVVHTIAILTGFKFQPADDPMELIGSMAPFSIFSSTLRQLAIDLIKIVQDLKLLNMGPKAGVSEIRLPEVEPGSSIMPGKINPSILEAVHMAAYEIMGFDHAIALAAQAGQLQLNVMTPLILFNLTFGLRLLTNTLKMFREFCVEGIQVDEKRVKELFEKSLVTATALSPYLGYDQTTKLVKEALEKGKTIREVVLEKSLLDEKDLGRILAPDHTTKPAIPDQTLFKKLQKKSK